MPIALKNGLPIIKEGAVSCTCCEVDVDIEFPINLNTPGTCACDYATEGGLVQRPCYSESLPAPSTVNIGFSTVVNPYAPLAKLGGEAAIQIPWDFTTTPALGWKTAVTEPSLMRLSGNVGGDVVIVARRVNASISGRYEGSPPEAVNFDLIPQQNEFPCGACGKNGGAHEFSAIFAMYPNTIYLVQIISYLPAVPGTSVPECSPWLQASLTRLAVLPP